MCFSITAGHVENSEKKCMLEINHLQFPSSWICFLFVIVLTGRTMVNHHQTTIWEDISLQISKHGLSQTQVLRVKPLGDLPLGGSSQLDENRWAQEVQF